MEKILSEFYEKTKNFLCFFEETFQETTIFDEKEKRVKDLFGPLTVTVA